MSLFTNRKCPICDKDLKYVKIDTGHPDTEYRLHGCMHINIQTCYSIKEIQTEIDKVFKDFESFRLKGVKEHSAKEPDEYSFPVYAHEGSLVFRGSSGSKGVEEGKCWELRGGDYCGKIGNTLDPKSFIGNFHIEG